MEQLIATATELPSDVPEGAPVPAGYQVPGSWVVDEDGIHRVGKSGALVQVSHTPTLITGRLVDGDGTEATRLAWRRDGEWREKVYDRDQLFTNNKLVALAQDGVSVSTMTAGDVTRCLSDLEAANMERQPVTRMTSRLGWQHGTRVFVARADGDVVFHGPDQLRRIAGRFHPGGTCEGWQQAVRVLDEHPRAALGMYAALAAPLLDIIGCLPFVVDWAGESSRGKTTTLRAAASVWGEPEVMRTWDATPVAIETYAGMLSGLPLLLDETKLARSPQDVARVVYGVAQGEGRGRGARQGGLRDTVTWSTVVLSTGEQPITTFTSDAGTRGRVVSVWGSPFTVEDRRLVDDLAHSLAEHYGHAGAEFVKWLLGRRKNWPQWRKQRQKLADELAGQADGVIAERRAHYVALLCLTAGLAKRSGILAFQPDFDWWASLLTTGAGREDDDQPAQRWRPPPRPPRR